MSAEGIDMGYRIDTMSSKTKNTEKETNQHRIEINMVLICTNSRQQKIRCRKLAQEIKDTARRPTPNYLTNPS